MDEHVIYYRIELTSGVTKSGTIGVKAPDRESAARAVSGMVRGNGTYGRHDEFSDIDPAEVEDITVA